MSLILQIFSKDDQFPSLSLMINVFIAAQINESNIWFRYCVSLDPLLQFSPKIAWKLRNFGLGRVPPPPRDPPLLDSEEKKTVWCRSCGMLLKTYLKFKRKWDFGQKQEKPIHNFIILLWYRRIDAPEWFPGLSFQISRQVNGNHRALPNTWPDALADLWPCFDPAACGAISWSHI